MRRRSLITATLAAAAWPWLAAAQTQTPLLPPLQPIQPENALERAFIAAFEDEEMRPAFRRLLLEQPVALALTSSAADAPPLERPLSAGATAGLIFTSAARLSSVLGAGAPHAVTPGRRALERLRGKYAVLNYRLAPMLTLEPDDIARYLES